MLTWFRARVSRLIFVVARQRVDEDLRFEIDAHLDSLAERYRREGMSPDEAYVAARRAIREIDPEIAVGEARPLADLVEASLTGRQQQTQLFAAFGSVALFIAGVGVYAVMSFTVSRRRREMNILVALGAPRRTVVGRLMRQGMTPVLFGVVAGVGGALTTGNLVAGLLFDVDARDPMIIGGVVAIVVSVGLMTCALALRRGFAIDPSVALREQ